MPPLSAQAQHTLVEKSALYARLGGVDWQRAGLAGVPCVGATVPERASPLPRLHGTPTCTRGRGGALAVTFRR